MSKQKRSFHDDLDTLDNDWEHDSYDEDECSDGFNKHSAKRCKRSFDHKTQRKIAAREARRSNKWSDDYAY
ncbi:hypothetical protein [Thalassotalea fusca]